MFSLETTCGLGAKVVKSYGYRSVDALLPVMSLMVDVVVAGGDSPRNYSVRWCSFLQHSVMCSVPSVVVFPRVLWCLLNDSL